MSDPILDSVIRAAREEREREEVDPATLDPELQDLFRPLSAEAKEKNLARVLREVRGENAAPIVPLPARRRWVTIASAIAAVAAAVVIAVSYPSLKSDPLPEYTLAISGGAAKDRGPEAIAETPVFGPETKLEIVLRPKRAAEGAITFRAFVVQGEQWTPWSPPSTVGESGSIKISGPASALLPFEPGDYELVFLVGRPRELERSLDQAARASTLRHKLTIAGKK